MHGDGPGWRGLRGAGARVRSLWHGLWRRREIEAGMEEEFRHHLELRTDDLIRQGLAPAEAARRARVEFGGIEAHRADARSARGLHILDGLTFSWLDVKLGARMLARHPGLSVVSVIGLSVATAIGAGGFAVVHAMLETDLPLDEGGRVVALQNTDARSLGSVDLRSTYDFMLWREELESVREISAFASARLSVGVDGEAVVPVAHMTASGFRVARVAPELGRALLQEDEIEGAIPVVVIAHEEWQRRFAGDPGIIGRTIRLGGDVHTVVGVMPEGFRFPVNHRYWLPLRLGSTQATVGGGPPILIFGRLAAGASAERAQAELTAIGARVAAAYPETHGHLRPRVLPFTHANVGVDGPAMAWLFRAGQVALALLLVVVAVNVAILFYARTATRAGEIVVRTALGASRRRVVTQLFAEALVLSSLAALIGLAMARLGLGWFASLIGGAVDSLPFWVDFGLSPALIAYAAGLAVLAAAIVGVVPALRATGPAIQAGLQRLSMRGSSMRLGGTWTALVVVQVAVAVAVLPYSLYVGGRLLGNGLDRPDYPVDAFVHARISAERDSASGFAAHVAEILRRISADPSVAAVTFGAAYPGQESETFRYEAEGTGVTRWAWHNRVAVDLVDVFEVPVLSGRGLGPSDAASHANVALVDEVFAERVLGGGPVVGRRVRRWLPAADGSSEPVAGPWLEIVGVVAAFAPPPAVEEAAPRILQALALEDAPSPVHVAIRVAPGTSPVSVLGRVRDTVRSVNAELRIGSLQTAAQEERERRQGILAIALGVAAVVGSVLLLSAGGVYAMMSFVVASRRREIGIRSALGAAPGHVLGAVFRRAALQLGAGVAAGLLLAEAIPRATGGSFFAGEGARTLPVVVAIVAAVGLLGALGPARRGLSVQPTEALREE